MNALDFKQKLEQLKYELTEKPKEMLTTQAKNKLLGLEEEKKDEKIDGRNLKKLTTIASGAYYSKDGYFIGKVGNAEYAFIVDTERGSLISDMVNYRNADLKEELAKYDIYGSELSNRDLMIFATICIREESVLPLLSRYQIKVERETFFSSNCAGVKYPNELCGLSKL